MRRYNIVQPLLLAFYSHPLYCDVGKSWRMGFSLLYLLFLVAVCYLPLAIINQVYITHTVNTVTPWLSQLPTINIVNGEVSIDQPVPFYVKDPKSGQVTMIIDTSDTVTPIEHTTAKILLTKNKLIISEAAGGAQAYDLSGIKNKSYNQERINAFLPAMKYAFVGFYPLAVILYFIQGLLEAMFYAFLAWLFIKTDMAYKKLWSLAIVALTPKFVLVTLLGIFSLTFPYKWIVYFALGLGYLFYAIDANLRVQANP